jgi:RNA polymerase sigma-70 factor (ECF subfamily)
MAVRSRDGRAPACWDASTMIPYDMRTDEALVEAANLGDAAAFETLYTRYRDWVMRMAYRFTASQADSLDVLQETFTYLARKFPGFRLRAKITTFLYPVVKHVALRHKQKRSRYVSDDALVGELAVPPKPGRALQRQELAAALAALPDKHREVLLMRFADDMSLREIAETLRIRLGTVKSRLHNALKTLRNDERTRTYFQL